MAAVLFQLRAELRSRLRSWLALALLAGVGAGLVITAAAGARRTESAVPRSAAASNFSDVSVSQFGQSNLRFDLVRRLPEVAYAYRTDNFYFTGKTDRGHNLDVGKSGLYASADASVGTSRDAQPIVHGRPADPNRVDEAVADEDSARMLGLRVGSRFTANFASADQFKAFFAYNGDPAKFVVRGPHRTFKVVGISAVFSTPSTNYPETQLTPAFYRAEAARLAKSPVFGVYLVHGNRDLPGFKAGVERLAHGAPVGFSTKGDFVSQVQRGVHLQAAALWVLAALAAIVTLLVLGQALARQTFVESTDYPTLRALGMTSGQLFRLALTRAAAIGIVGAGLAAGLAILLSPLTPVGSLARKAEPHPGLSVDVLIVGAGAAITILMLVALAAIPAWRAVRVLAGPDESWRASPERPSPLGDRLARAGFSLAAVNGVRMALESGRGRTAVPVRTTIAGVTVAIAAIATALSFSASLDRLVHTPRLYGQNWDAQLGDGYSDDIAGEAYPQLRQDRSIGAFAGGTINEASIAGERVGILALESVQGSIDPSVTEGRAPTRPDEVLLADKTLAKSGTHVGDVITISVGKRSARARVVGKGVISDIEGAHPLLGGGALLTFEGYKRLVPNAPRNYFLVRFAAGVNKKAGLKSLERVGALAGGKPVDLANFNRVDSMPNVIGGLLGAVAIATLVHTLMTSIRRRRRDLAILKTLGFERRQVARTVAWQATTIVLVALTVGIPLGIAGGRWAWTIFADELGVVREPVIPLAPILLLIPAAILAANVTAALPARLAARTRPALVLRAE
jgi:ABC-type lipoprotein release transport system permease subunit